MEIVVCVLDDYSPEDVLLGAWVKNLVPLKIGTLRPATLHEIKAFVTTFGRVVLPATHVIPISTLSYYLHIYAAIMIANASSPPTSQSMIKYLDVGI